MTDLYNANAGVKGRDGGPYLDEIEARASEERAAYIEGREPDFDKYKSSPRMRKVTKTALVQQTVDNTFDGDVTAEPVISVEIPSAEAEPEGEVVDAEVVEDDKDDEDNEFGV